MTKGEWPSQSISCEPLITSTSVSVTDKARPSYKIDKCGEANVVKAITTVHFAALRILGGWPELMGGNTSRSMGGVIMGGERMIFTHADHIGMHVKCQHFSTYFWGWPLMLRIIENINGRFLSKIISKWIYVSQTDSALYIIGKYNCPLSIRWQGIGLHRAYTSFQCSHDVGQPFSKYVTYFLRVKHVPDTIKLYYHDVIYYKIECWLSFTLRCCRNSHFKVNKKILYSIKYPNVIYQPALKGWFICGSKDFSITR